MALFCPASRHEFHTILFVWELGGCWRGREFATKSELKVRGVFRPRTQPQAELVCKASGPWSIRVYC